MARLLVGTALAVIAACLVVAAHAHSVPADPAVAETPNEGYPPGADAPLVATAIPGAPPQVQSVVNQFKLWRTGTTLPACFLNGGEGLRSFFVSTTRTWLNQGGLRIDFGTAPTYRDCRGPTDRSIRVAFGYQQSAGRWDTGNWSYVRTDANTATPGPTVNIGYAANSDLNQLDRRELRRLVLHEIGHTLGLEHEHQSPLARCEFDWSKVVPYYQRQYGWNEQLTRFNLEKLAPTPGIQATPFDPASIMNYGFPAWMFLQTAGQNCEIKENYEPSPTDLSSYATVYPGRPQALASDSARSSTPTSASPVDTDVRAAQEEQARALATRAANAVAELQKLLSDEGQRRQAAELISRIAQQQFPGFGMDLQNNMVQVGNITQRTDGPCGSNIAGVGGNVTLNSNCVTSNKIETQNNVQGTQNNVQGNQINNNGTLNNQGGINFGTQPK